MDTIQILDDLIIIYADRGDERNVARSNAEIDKLTEDTDNQIATVKDFLSFLSETVVQSCCVCQECFASRKVDD